MTYWIKNSFFIFFLIVGLSANAQEYRWLNPPVKIVVLGSSTAAGNGVSTRDSAWVNRYDAYLKSFHPENQVINLAVGGYNTYHIMPDDFIPPNRRKKSDRLRNITQAIELGCDGIIVNLPSNDVANGYSTKEQLENFRKVVDLADSNDIPIWICTVQPRNFNRQRQRRQQAALNDSIKSIFPSNFIDFWTDFSTTTHGVVPNFDSGDGCHLNDGGHDLLNRRVIGCGAFDSLLICTSEKEPIWLATPQYGEIKRIQFTGAIQNTQTNDMVIVEVFQFDTIVASIKTTKDYYSIETDIDFRSPFQLKYRGEGILTKSIAFNPKGDKISYKDVRDVSGFNYMNYHVTRIEEIKSLRIPDNLVMTHYDVSINRNWGLFTEDEQFARLQSEKLQSLKTPIINGRVKRYSLNESLYAKLKYKNGALHGKCTWYDQYGSKLVRARFENGHYSGKYIEYSPDGNKIKIEQRVSRTK